MLTSRLAKPGDVLTSDSRRLERADKPPARRRAEMLRSVLTPVPACVTCAVYGKTIRHAQQTSNTSVWVLYYGGIFWDVGRRQRGLVFSACLWRLGVMYGE